MFYLNNLIHEFPYFSTLVLFIIDSVSD